MINKEYGSDFHFISEDFRGNNNLFKKTSLYANGRQPIIDLIYQHNWKRIWMPEYFCYDIINSIKKTGIQVLFYKDYPGATDIEAIKGINFQKDDVLFRMNFFGLRSKRSNTFVPVPVIEDHSHDLVGEWAQNSDADWCIASLRKSLPLAEGGVLWSPKDSPLPSQPNFSKENEELANMRWKAMHLKSKYLNGNKIDKKEFRSVFIDTERGFENLSVSSLDKTSIGFFRNFDIKKWYKQKNINWSVLTDINFHGIEILPKESTKCQSFNFSFLLPNNEKREEVKKELIKENIFPVVLWDIPSDKSEASLNISHRILSLACDGRYSEEDMKLLKIKLENILQNII